jgi:hypothetical protein
MSISGRRQAKTQGAQFFSFTVVTPPLNTAEYKDMMGFLAEQQGQFDTFEIVLPNLSTPAGSVTGNVLDVVGAHTAGVKSIAVDGGTASQTDYLKRGDLVRFSTDPKVYILTADANTDGSGAATLSIEPGIITALADNDTVETNDVKFTVFLGSPSQEFETGLENFTQLEFDAQEAF